MSLPQFDNEGFLIELNDWNEAVAEQVAVSESLQLTDVHWQIIYALRNFYARTDLSPAMRPFVKLVKTEVDASLGTSIVLMQLFGSSPAKTAAKIAGLPKPTNCI